MSPENRRSVVLAACGIILSLQMATSAVAQSISPSETRAIVKDAYIYGFPVRLYRPHPEILNGAWKFLDALPVR